MSSYYYLNNLKYCQLYEFHMRFKYFSQSKVVIFCIKILLFKIFSSTYLKKYFNALILLFVNFIYYFGTFNFYKITMKGIFSDL